MRFLSVTALAVAMISLGSAMDASANENKVRMKTSHGEIAIELEAEKAPITVENFLGYVKSGFYDGLIFHRVIPGFMVQGGGFEPGMKERPERPTIENESANGLRNLKYTLAMARTPDPHSASSQFFINVADNGFLDREQAQDGWGYAVFGKVVEGQDVIDKIAGVKTGSAGHHQDVPVEDVLIEKAWVE